MYYGFTSTATLRTITPGCEAAACPKRHATCHLMTCHLMTCHLMTCHHPVSPHRRGPLTLVTRHQVRPTAGWCPRGACWGHRKVHASSSPPRLSTLASSPLNSRLSPYPRLSPLTSRWSVGAIARLSYPSCRAPEHPARPRHVAAGAVAAYVSDGAEPRGGDEECQ